MFLPKARTSIGLAWQQKAMVASKMRHNARHRPQLALALQVERENCVELFEAQPLLMASVFRSIALGGRRRRTPATETTSLPHTGCLNVLMSRARARTITP